MRQRRRKISRFASRNSIVGLIFVHVVYGLAFTTLFFRNFYVSIPVELTKAAVLAMGGQGAGGRPDFAQGGAPDGGKANEGLAAIKAALV